MNRRCLHCSRLLRASARADARFCSSACRSARWQRRRRTTRALARKRRCAVCRKSIAISVRADTCYCSSVCRQAGYRRRQAAAAAAKPPRKAHQRVIRERLATVSLVSDIDRADVQPITLAAAKAIIERYEWLGTMPAVSRYAFGIFFDGHCGGAVVYGDEPAENLGVWDRYGFTGKIIALLRGACEPWAHPHAGSKLIRSSMALLPARYQIVTATVDGMAGEIGTIYQACGFDYVGVMRTGGRALIHVNGKALSERQAYRLAGTRGARALAKLGFDVIAVPRRARYFGFRGDRRERQHHRAAIAHLLQPYPKRAHAPANSSTERTFTLASRPQTVQTGRADLAALQPARLTSSE